ncbi:small ribosomal subunit protein uS17m [Culicoides brevitarsis]|uniref:small ribosomal subunit protein uS17m n=1 Tax=Culicoides brevitarsis TaxID=469753 RepID=UPI00307BE703
MAATRSTMLLGKVWPCVKKNAAKIKVKKMVLDQNLNMYFNEHQYIFAHDPQKICKTGDIVLIKELPKKLTTLITHSVEKIVFPLGDITDPITGKKVVVGKYRDEIEEKNKLFGKKETAYDYEKQPPRGRLEGIRDFTDKPTYIKYHDDGKEHPYAK